MLGFLIKFIILSYTTSLLSCDNTSVCSDNISNSSTAITALILARGGSKGIKLKNIQTIQGVSLLGISLTALQEARRFETIWVSTDHEAIAEETTKYNVNVHWRDPQTALDTTSSIESIQEFLTNHPKVTNLALIQCTSPFITSRYLRRAVKAFKKRHCIFSVVQSFKLRWKRDQQTSNIVPVNFNYTKRPRRQDWNGELIEAGMFYFSERKLLDKSLFQDDRCGVVTIKAEDSMEIDTPTDLEIARVLFKLKTSQSNKSKKPDD